MILAVFTLCLPLKQLRVTSSYGYRIHPITGAYQLHNGVDLKADYDTVFAVCNSRVKATGYDPRLGIFIKITNGPFTITYGHLSKFFVQTADSLEAGSAVGVSGATGRVTGPHLHFAVQFNGRYIDPLAFLSAAYHQIINP